MRFTTFMKRNYITDEGPAGCLARSIKADGRNFPVRRSRKTYKKYLETYCQADDGVLAAFEKCFEEWKELEDGTRKNDRAKTRKSG